MSNGLTTEEQKTITAVFARVPAIERAVLFGSRAMGLARGNSDVDIALYGDKLGLPDILHTASLLEETPLPYHFDLISRASITSPELLEHIRQYGKEMYRKERNAPTNSKTKSAKEGEQSSIKRRLGDICIKIGSGATPRGGKEAYKERGIAIIRSQNVLDYTFSTDGLAYIDDMQAAQLDNVTVQKNDVLVNITGDSVARACIAPNELLPARVNQHVAIVRADCKKANSHYLLYFLQFKKEYLLSIASSGGTRNALTKKMLEDIEVNLPPLATQCVIATALSSLDDKIENNRKINQCLEQMAQAMFDRLIIEESINEPLGVLADIAKINPTRMLKRGQNAAYVEMANLPTYGAFPNNWEIKSFTGGMKFKNGDTILARISPCLQNGKTAYINFLNEGEVAFGSTEYIVISSKKDYCNEMFYFLARYPDFVNYAVGNMNGSSGRQRVSGDALKNYELHIPTKENVRKFAMFATPVMNIILQNSLENRNLAALRDALLPKLISGEIRVPEAKESKEETR